MNTKTESVVDGNGLWTSPKGRKFMVTCTNIHGARLYTARTRSGAIICQGVTDEPTTDAERLAWVAEVKEQVDFTKDDEWLLLQPQRNDNHAT